ncbi:MAG: 50S ribosomal protein L10 [Caldilineaceae bacterium]|nr:50S ribosomal protein L10 [Caldilineaceae bacterium]
MSETPLRHVKAFFYLSERRDGTLPLSRSQKEALVKQYEEQISTSSALVFTNYKGVTVAQLRSLRGKLKESGTTYAVVKNSLFGLALENVGREKPAELLQGANAVAFVGEDIGRGVTALKDWIKAERIIEINGALLESSVLNATQADALSDLPTKEQTLAMVLGAINAPASSLARMVAAPGASLARVINAYVEKQKEAEAA